jgi:hypothetical protein
MFQRSLRKRCLRASGSSGPRRAESRHPPPSVALDREQSAEPRAQVRCRLHWQSFVHRVPTNPIGPDADSACHRGKRPACCAMVSTSSRGDPRIPEDQPHQVEFLRQRRKQRVKASRSRQGVNERTPPSVGRRSGSACRLQRDVHLAAATLLTASGRAASSNGRPAGHCPVSPDRAFASRRRCTSPPRGGERRRAEREWQNS